MSGAAKHTAFTPGPWSLASRRAGGAKLMVLADACPSGPEMACVAEAFSMTDGDANTGEANARLIAAAPDMLSALGLARDALDNPQIISNFAVASVRIAIADAIALATPVLEREG